MLNLILLSNPPSSSLVMLLSNTKSRINLNTKPATTKTLTTKIRKDQNVTSLTTKSLEIKVNPSAIKYREQERNITSKNFI